MGNFFIYVLLVYDCQFFESVLLFNIAVSCEEYVMLITSEWMVIEHCWGDNDSRIVMYLVKDLS